MILADTPSLGLIIGLPVGVGCVLLGITVFFVAGHASWWDEDLLSGKAGRRWGVGIAVVAVVVTAFAMWPWGHDYHFWKPIDGRVDKISSRFISAGDKGGTNQRFVVVVGGRPYGVDDTRASLLKVGDTVHLKCKREFVWGSGDNGWGCNWNGGGA